jgi:hypothetical protein
MLIGTYRFTIIGTGHLIVEIVLMLSTAFSASSSTQRGNYVNLPHVTSTASSTSASPSHYSNLTPLDVISPHISPRSSNRPDDHLDVAKPDIAPSSSVNTCDNKLERRSAEEISLDIEKMRANPTRARVQAQGCQSICAFSNTHARQVRPGRAIC